MDTLIVPGGDGVLAAAADGDLVAWVQATAAHARRVVGVCSGTFILGAAGILSGRRVTTHWARGASLAARHPDVHVDTDAIWARDGNVWTSAGVTAGIDVSLALVEDDHGVDVADTVARWLVMFLRRPGGQSQFASPVWRTRARDLPLRQVQDAIDADPSADHRVSMLASRAAMSERHFIRRFTDEVGLSPARYVAAVRLDSARRELEQSHDTVAAIAARVGFGTAESMRRTFVRHLGASPESTAGASRTDRIGDLMTTSIAIPLFPQFTALDGIGPYEVLQRIPDFVVTFVGRERGVVRSDNGFLGIEVDATYDELPGPDVVVFPGGIGTRALLADEQVLDWVRGAHATSTFTTSVCTGSLVLAAAGLLEGLTATTHWAARDILTRYGAIISEDRVVEHLDHRIITAAGVSSGIDMALRLVELLVDRTAAEASQLMIEYDPQPPFDAGAPTKASDEVIERVAEYAAARN